MNKALKLFSIPLFIGFYVACSPVKFAKDSEYRKCQEFGQDCTPINGKDYFDYSVTAAGGLVDILVVDDNSASMSYEQSQLAGRLSNFIRNLENQSADYRIAITTTDISGANNAARAINKNGALQDGRLIQFPNGEYFLTNKSGTLDQKDAWFKQTVVRQETLTCENFIKGWTGSRDSSAYSSAYITNCPSGDERGIHAANLVVKNNPNSFLRKEAHLAIIFLTDEDERSQLYYYNQKNPGSYPGYDLAEMDQPAILINNVAAQYAGAKVLSAHSIIVMTQECLNQQNSQMSGLVNGSYGLKYYELSDATGGVKGDICASDYTTQLGQISTNILSRINSIPLACENPEGLAVAITGQSGVTYTVSGKELKFNTALAPGATANLKYSCPTL